MALMNPVPIPSALPLLAREELQFNRGTGALHHSSRQLSLVSMSPRAATNLDDGLAGGSKAAEKVAFTVVDAAHEATYGTSQGNEMVLRKLRTWRWCGGFLADYERKKRWNGV